MLSSFFSLKIHILDVWNSCNVFCLPVSAAETLELAEVLQQAVRPGAAVQVVTLLARDLGAAHGRSLNKAQLNILPEAK